VWERKCGGKQSCSGRKSVSCGKDPILLIPNKQDTLQQREGVRCKNQWMGRAKNHFDDCGSGYYHREEDSS